MKVPRLDQESEEFSAKKGLIICSDCGAVYWKKRWHHSLEKLNFGDSEKISQKDTPTKFAICPACKLIKNRQYEGRIRIKNLPEQHAKALEELVEGFGRRAYDRDPMDRVISMGKKDGEWVITTTENQLANKLANKIESQFRNSKSKTHFGPEPSDVAEITIEFS